MRPLTTMIALALSTSLANAGGLNLRWNDCAADGGVQNLKFACDSNAGSTALVASIVLDEDLSKISSTELSLTVGSEIGKNGPGIPSWWTFKSLEACRTAALTLSAHDGSSCSDPFLGQAVHVVASQTMRLGYDLLYDYSHIAAITAVPNLNAVDLLAGKEYGLATWTISHVRTVGSSACPGCSTPLVLVFGFVEFFGPENHLRHLMSGAEVRGDDLACWQSEGGCETYVVSTKRSTWSAVKALYR